MSIRMVIGVWTAIAIVAGVILVVNDSAWGGLLAASGIAGLVPLLGTLTDDREFYHQFSQALCDRAGLDALEHQPGNHGSEDDGDSVNLELPTSLVGP